MIRKTSQSFNPISIRTLRTHRCSWNLGQNKEAHFLKPQAQMGNDWLTWLACPLHVYMG